MMQLGRTLALATTLAAAGCATEEKYAAQAQSWVGRPESELLANWGAPDRSYEADGAKYLTYTRQSLITTGDYYDPWYSGYRYRGYGAPRTSVGSCETTFVVANGSVRRVSYRGNDCRAS
jgi:hypothetical protein